METITFVDNVTKANAETFNTMQSNIEDAIDIINKYSTNEIRIGTWIDNKPLYRKVYTLVKTTAKTSWTDFGDLPANIGIITNCHGVVQEQSGNMKPVPYYESENYYEGILVKPSTGKIQYMSTYINSTSYITIEYTKTTD